MEYFTTKVSLSFAEKKLIEIEKTIESLLFQPNRGYKPHELYKINTTKQLEIIVDKVRIIYEIKENDIFITAIFDSRQNVKTHLLKRMQKLH
jgi:plasmid stabilization system protein ParE